MKKKILACFWTVCPTHGGATLMKRRAAQLAKAKGERAKTLYEIDFLLGVYDATRMGALRFI